MKNVETIILKYVADEDDKKSPIREEVLKTNQRVLWSHPFGNKHFNIKSYVNARLPVTEDFPNDYEVVRRMGARNMSNMEDRHLLKVLMLYHILFVAHDQVEIFFNNLKDGLNTTKTTLAQEEEHWRLWMMSMMRQNYLKEN